MYVLGQKNPLAKYQKTASSQGKSISIYNWPAYNCCVAFLCSNSNLFEHKYRNSHKAWVSSLQWSPKEPHVLATSSHDGTIKMFDIRSSLPLYSTRAQSKGEKGLSLAFSTDSLFCGGSDCVVKKFAC